MDVLLGLDVGEKKIGVAVGDTTTRMAFPRPALLVEQWSEAWSPLLMLLHDNHVTQVVVGLPFNSDGSEGEQAARIRTFVDELRLRTSIDIVVRDERFSSQAVQREQQASGKVLTRGQEDSLAAQLILEAYLQEQP